MTGPVWPGCVLPALEDVVEVDVHGLHDPLHLSQLCQQLGIALSSKAPVKELEGYELDESNARGQNGHE